MADAPAGSVDQHARDAGLSGKVAPTLVSRGTGNEYEALEPNRASKTTAAKARSATCAELALDAGFYDQRI